AGVLLTDHRLDRHRRPRLGHLVELALRGAAGDRCREGAHRPDAAGGGELLRRRAGQDDLSAEPGDRCRGLRTCRPRGGSLPPRDAMYHPSLVDHVRARVPAVHIGPVVDGRLVGKLRAIVGDEWTYTSEHELRTYESDGLLQYHVTPAVAVLPASTEQVAAVVKACADAEVPWVARGAGSGLSGGALPIAEGVLIVLSRMKRILEIDLDNARICVEPGVTNANVSAAVGPEFFYPPDPSSQ